MTVTGESLWVSLFGRHARSESSSLCPRIVEQYEAYALLSAPQTAYPCDLGKKAAQAPQLGRDVGQGHELPLPRARTQEGCIA